MKVFYVLVWRFGVLLTQVQVLVLDCLLWPVLTQLMLLLDLKWAFCRLYDCVLFQLCVCVRL